MKVADFTRNQPRHAALVRRLAAGDDDGSAKARYFRRMTDAEIAVFGPDAFPPENARILAVAPGDVSALGADGGRFDMELAPQDAGREIRYSRIDDFNETVAGEFLDRIAAGAAVLSGAGTGTEHELLRPRIL